MESNVSNFRVAAIVRQLDFVGIEDNRVNYLATIGQADIYALIPHPGLGKAGELLAPTWFELSLHSAQ